jgi:hypothetical protein
MFIAKRPQGKFSPVKGSVHEVGRNNHPVEVFMRWLLVLVLLVVLLATAGCASLYHKYDYSVAVVNDGQETIDVWSFKMSPDPTSYVLAGDLGAGGSKGTAPFHCSPPKSVIIKWQSLKMKGGPSWQEVPVELNVPKTFTRANGDLIEFHINPELEQVHMVYVLKEP